MAPTVQRGTAAILQAVLSDGGAPLEVVPESGQQPRFSISQSTSPLASSQGCAPFRASPRSSGLLPSRPATQAGVSQPTLQNAEMDDPAPTSKPEGVLLAATPRVAVWSAAALQRAAAAPREHHVVAAARGPRRLVQRLSPAACRQYTCQASEVSPDSGTSRGIFVCRDFCACLGD